MQCCLLIIKLGPDIWCFFFNWNSQTFLQTSIDRLHPSALGNKWFYFAGREESCLFPALKVCNVACPSVLDTFHTVVCGIVCPERGSLVTDEEGLASLALIHRFNENKEGAVQRLLLVVFASTAMFVPRECRTLYHLGYSTPYCDQ